MKKLILLLLLAGSFGCASAKAATPVKLPHGLSLSPAIVNTSIQPTESQHEIDFKLTNNESTSQSLNLTTRDFNTLNETGGLFFVGANPTQLQKKYGLANWVSLPQTHFVIEPKQTITVQALILNQLDLSPGGHYGALMVNLESNADSANKPNQVSLQPIASALLFVNKVGGELYHLKLTSVDESHTFWKLPTQVTLRFQNTGNTHLTPRGAVNLYAPGGKLVSHGVINQNSGIVLPEIARRFSVPLIKSSSSNRIGKYKLEVAWRFDGYDKYRSYQSSFLYATPVSILVLTALVILLFIAVRKLSLTRLRRMPLKSRQVAHRSKAFAKTARINGLGFSAKLLARKISRKQPPAVIMLSKVDNKPIKNKPKTKKSSKKPKAKPKATNTKPKKTAAKKPAAQKIRTKKSSTKKTKK